MEYTKNLVSVIMPAHNSEDTIRDAVRSVIVQSYENWELLIIDDCSTDGTVQVIEEYLKDLRVRLIKTDKSVGKPYYPRNFGIRESRGQYIAFLDSDDVWLPNKLVKQIPLFKDERVAMVFSNYVKFVTGEENSNRVVKGPKELTYKKALYGNDIGNLTAMYDISKVGKVFFEDVGHEDYLLWLRILKKGYKAVNTGTLEAKYRISTNSVSANKYKSALWAWNIYRNILKMNMFYAGFCYLFYAVKGIIKYFK